MGKLADVDLSKKLSKADGQKQLEAAQKRLLAVRLQAGGLLGDHRLGPPVAVVFEGWDASGKGGAIRRLTAPLDPRHVRVTEFSAPTEREKRHHFLWRFWPVLPGWGGMAIFDRSWYGRVLVERIEGFATDAEWQRAYEEIVRFERSLVQEGMVIVKFWLHVSEKEQLRRLRARERNPLKQWKLSDEDWRNVSRRADYELAVDEMLQKTDHKHARWRLIPAESKPFARVAVINQVVEAIEGGLRAAGQKPVDVHSSR